MASKLKQSAQRWALEMLEQADPGAAFDGASHEEALEIGAEVKRLAEVLRAALAQPAAGEPVYQWADQDLWMDGDEADLASARAEGFKTRTLWTAPPAAAHGDEALEIANNDLARAMAWIEKFKGMFGAIADGSAFYLSTAAEGRRRCQGILVRYEQDQAAMRAQAGEVHGNSHTPAQAGEGG